MRGRVRRSRDSRELRSRGPGLPGPRPPGREHQVRRSRPGVLLARDPRQSLLVKLVGGRAVAAAEQGGDGSHVRRLCHRPARRRRGDPAVQLGRRARREGAPGEELPGVRVRVQVDEDGRRTRWAQPEFVGDPAPGKGRVADRRRGGAGQREVRKPLTAVQLELSRHEHGQRSGRRRRRAQPGQDGLRLQRVGQFDDVGRLGPRQHRRGDGREHREHGGRVHQTPPAHRRGREEQHGSGHRLPPPSIGHTSTVTAAHAKRGREGDEPPTRPRTPKSASAITATSLVRRPPDAVRRRSSCRRRACRRSGPGCRRARTGRVAAGRRCAGPVAAPS